MGFSLMEVLIALGIFAVGLVAVASIFPTAIAIQRETVRDLDARRIGKSAKSTLMAIAQSSDGAPGVNDPWAEINYKHDAVLANREGTLKVYANNTESMALANALDPNPVLPMIDLPELTNPGDKGIQRPVPVPDPNLTVDAPLSFHGLFTQELRSYPSGIDRTDRRDYYWYPLIQVTDLAISPKWFMYLMVMHRSGSELPPQIREARLDTRKTVGSRIEFDTTIIDRSFLDNDADDDGLPDLIQPGDTVLASDGKVHKVILADRTGILVNSPQVGKPTLLYYAVAIDGGGNVKRESRSPIVWIEEKIELVVHEP